MSLKVSYLIFLFKFCSRYLNNKPLNSVRILDTSPFPIFGLEILSLASADNSNDVEIYYTDNSLTKVLKKCKRINNYYSKIYHFDRNNWKKFDIIIINYINFYGEFNINSIENQIYTE